MSHQSPNDRQPAARVTDGLALPQDQDRAYALWRRAADWRAERLWGPDVMQLLAIGARWGAGCPEARVELERLHTGRVRDAAGLALYTVGRLLLTKILGWRWRRDGR